MSRRILPRSRIVYAVMPAALHALLKRDAVVDSQSGGQVNINRQLVLRLYAACKMDLCESERREVEAYIAKL